MLVTNILPMVEDAQRVIFDSSPLQRRSLRWLTFLCIPLLSGLLTACDSSGKQDIDPGAALIPAAGCSGSCVVTEKQGNDDNVRLTTVDVQTIIAQGVAESEARSTEATVAVVDRVGNVLAVWRTGANSPRPVSIASRPDGNGGSLIAGGLEGIRGNTDALAAIAKAVTGAYLSSEGNAFSTRTAGQIVQEHFNPGELWQPAGPLFGVQFSQLACSDFVQAFDNIGPNVGPKRSPLGLSADPGGFPLYKNGTVVGGVGVISDHLYSLDRDISNTNADQDELIATAASFGYSAPIERRANRITADGKTLRYSDVGVEDLLVSPAAAPAYPPATGQLVAVPGYSSATIQTGLVFGQAESGIRPASAGNSDESAYVARGGYVLVDDLNTNRYPATAGTAPVGSTLQNDEVETLLVQALTIANSSRAQIRQPLSSKAEVTIAVVDTAGEVLGMVRTRDAPVFGADVALQKARTAAFFSSSAAAAALSTNGIDTRYVGLDGAVPSSITTVNLANYLTTTRTFLGSPSAFGDEAIAYSSRAIGNLARPFYPDGIDDSSNGPLSKPISQWSPFSTGLQLDSVMNGIVQHVLFAAGITGTDVSIGCGGIAHNPLGTFAPSPFSHRLLANGIQIFPGGVPIYRGNTLVGAIGVSGDGVDQDDMIAFLAIVQASAELAGAINNAPTAMRADTLEPRGVRLRYMQCPQAPFLGSTEQQPCEGL